jgi:hypothetical protein
MWEDPIVKEIRQQRKQIEETCNNDFIEIFKNAIAIQKKYSNRVVSKPARKNK